MVHADSTDPAPRTPDLATPLRRQQETAALGDAIAELAARIQAATYELLAMIHQFDERGGWGDGFTSCAHWLNWRTGLAMGAAREKVRVAKALAELPRVSAAMRRGTVSYSKVRAITRVATADTEERLLVFAAAAPRPTSNGWCERGDVAIGSRRPTTTAGSTTGGISRRG